MNTEGFQDTFLGLGVLAAIFAEHSIKLTYGALFLCSVLFNKKTNNPWRTFQTSAASQGEWVVEWSCAGAFSKFFPVDFSTPPPPPCSCCSPKKSFQLFLSTHFSPRMGFPSLPNQTVCPVFF